MRNKKILHVCSSSNPKVRKRLIACADCDFIFACHDCCKNILAGNIDLQPKKGQKLLHHKASIRELGNPGRMSLKCSRAVLHNGVFLTALIFTFSAILGPIVSTMFNR